MQTGTIALYQLHADIDSRAQSIRENRADWPCAKGCDRCCHELAEMPQLTETEWMLLREELAALPDDQLAAIRGEIARLAEDESRPVTCPLLDRSSGACPVYRQRPVACRTYGFYVQRDLGLYCGGIEARVADGTLADVVWGNQDAIDRALAALGEMRSLVEWFDRWDQDMAL
ncbi:MAG: YkgJ family cysteine cluster protein [Propionivibrio sp.]